MTAISMICSVIRLEVESHTVRLLRSSSDDGMMNGNSANPAVNTTPATAMQDNTKATTARRSADAMRAIIVPPNAASGRARR